MLCVDVCVSCGVALCVMYTLLYVMGGVCRVVHVALMLCSNVYVMMFAVLHVYTNTRCDVVYV